MKKVLDKCRTCPSRRNLNWVDDNGVYCDECAEGRRARLGIHDEQQISFVPIDRTGFQIGNALCVTKILQRDGFRHGQVIRDRRGRLWKIDFSGTLI